MSGTTQSQPAINAFCGEHHFIDWKVELHSASLHKECFVGKLCVLAEEQFCPKTKLFVCYQRSGLWDACDPKHRACHIGEPCMVTGEKYCARNLYVAKYEHVNGTCSSRGPDHLFCPTISELDQQYLFPGCPACVILTEARGLVLIHRRMLDECVDEEGLSGADVDCIRMSLSGYMRAYNVRRRMHMEELQKESQMIHDLEMDYASGSGEITKAQKPITGRRRGWKSLIESAIKAVFSIGLEPR